MHLASVGLVALLVPALAFAPQSSRPATESSLQDLEPLDFPPPSPFSAERDATEAGLREFIATWPKMLESDAGLERTRSRLLKRAAAESKPAPPESRAALPIALLPRAKTSEWMWFMQVGGVLQYARPLWRSRSWSADDLARADLIDQFLRLMPAAPRLQCRADDVAKNNEQMDLLVRWYWRCLDTPEVFAKMIFTMDDGPFIGVALEKAPVLEPVASRELGNSMKLELCKRADEAEPFVFRLMRDSKSEWLRVISDSPECTVRHAELTGEPGDAGVYGWVVPFAVKWRGGHERASLYLGPNGEFRFYFLSW